MCDACAMRPPPVERAPLPHDPWSLPEPGPAWEGALDAGVSALGLSLTPGVRRALEAHSRLLLAWTAAINLTAIRDPEGVARLHLVDSLAGVAAVARLAGPSPAILDLGSGGGMPGLPLAAALPAGRLLMVDSIGKKVRFLEVAAAAVAEALEAAGEPVPLLEARAVRAEDLAREHPQREAWDVVTARAVGTLAELVELAMPLLQPGGVLICWKRDDGAGSLGAEAADAAAIARATGAGAARIDAAPERALAGHRLVILRKERPTPDRYPRSPAERKRAAGG